jgi:hypothetical protein
MEVAADAQVFLHVKRLGGIEEAEPHPLDDITAVELEEIRQLKHPPDTCRRIMECIHLILSEGPLPRLSDGVEWADVLRTVVGSGFLKRIRRYDTDLLRERPALVDRLCRYYLAGDDPLQVDRVYRASRTVVAFFGWTVAAVAGVLPAWSDEQVAGAAARRHIEALESARRWSARQRAKQLAEEQAEAVRAEERRLEVMRQLENAKRLQDAAALQQQQMQQQKEEEAAAVQLQEMQQQMAAEEAAAKAHEVAFALEAARQSANEGAQKKHF